MCSAALCIRDLDFGKRLVGLGCMPMSDAYTRMFDEMWETDEAMHFDFIPAWSRYTFTGYCQIVRGWKKWHPGIAIWRTCLTLETM